MKGCCKACLGVHLRCGSSSRSPPKKFRKASRLPLSLSTATGSLPHRYGYAAMMSASLVFVK